MSAPNLPASLPTSLLRLPVTHRALHDRAAGRIENSLSAVAAAAEAGYAIEIDLQLSSDGQAMVFHDERLDRLTDATGPVSARSSAELSQIALKDGKGDQIPTLPEVLALVAGRVPLLIEIKDQTGVMGETDGRLEAAVAEALRDYQGDVALMSFNPHAVARMAQLAPQLPRGITSSSFVQSDWPELPAAVCDHLRDIPDYERVGASFISHQGNDLTRPRVLALKAAGANILCWTIRSPEQEAIVRQLAENITFEGYLSPLPTA